MVGSNQDLDMAMKAANYVCANVNMPTVDV